MVPDRSTFDVEMAIEKLTRYISPSTHHNPAELIQAGSIEYVLKYEKFIIQFGIRTNCLGSGRRQIFFFLLILLLILLALPSTLNLGLFYACLSFVPIRHFAQFLSLLTSDLPLNPAAQQQVCLLV
jgi:hypothetical protein